MAGRWVESNQSDLEVLAALSGVDAAAVLKTAGEWLDTPDPPVRREGQFWYFTTKREGLLFLASRATQHDLSDWKRLLCEYLVKWTHGIGSNETRGGHISIVLATRHNWQKGSPRPWLRWEGLVRGFAFPR